MLGTELFCRRKLILALVLTMTSLHIDNRQLQGGGCKSLPYPLYQNRLAQFEFGIRHEHLPDREKGKRTAAASSNESSAGIKKQLRA